MPRTKRFLQRSGTNVPLVMLVPPKWRHLAAAAPGARLTRSRPLRRLRPTVLSLAGVKIPEYMQGRAFAGAAKAAPNEYVFCTRDRMDERYDMMRSAMDSRWLYIRNYRPDLPYVQPLEYQFRARGYQSWARMAREGKLTAATAMFWGRKPSEEATNSQPTPTTSATSPPIPRIAIHLPACALRCGSMFWRFATTGFCQGSPWKASTPLAPPTPSRGSE